MLKSITQEHGMGCGVASVAFLLKISYKEALGFFDAPSNAWGKGYYCKDIVKALNNAGKVYKFAFFKDDKRELLRLDNIIVYIKPSPKYPAGHYLAKIKNRWMNPWINFPCIAPAKSGFQKELPGEVGYVIYPLQEKIILE